MKEAGMEAEICRVLELNVVVSCMLFQNAVEAAINPVPLMFSVKVGPPAVAFDGNRLVTAGVSLKGWVLLPQPASRESNTRAQAAADANLARRRMGSLLPTCKL